MKKYIGKILFVSFLILVAVIKYDEKYPIANPFAKLHPIEGVNVNIKVPPTKAPTIGLGRYSLGYDLKAIENLTTTGVVRRTGTQSFSIYHRFSWAE